MAPLQHMEWVANGWIALMRNVFLGEIVAATPARKGAIPGSSGIYLIFIIFSGRSRLGRRGNSSPMESDIWTAPTGGRCHVTHRSSNPFRLCMRTDDPRAADALYLPPSLLRASLHCSGEGRLDRENLDGHRGAILPATWQFFRCVWDNLQLFTCMAPSGGYGPQKETL